jgi:hypothetical protein
MMPLPMHHMHDMSSPRSSRRESCVGDHLDVVWRAALRAETAWARCHDSAVTRPRRRRRARGGHLGTSVAGSPKRRPPGGRATGRLAR